MELLEKDFKKQTVVTPKGYVFETVSHTPVFHKPLPA